MEIFEFIFHIDKYLADVINMFGSWTYVILFLVIFAETGLVVTPFLPGDSLLFAVGSLSGGGYLNIWTIYFAILCAAIIGDSTNYWVGRYIGPKVFSRENSKIFKKAYLEKTREFYDKYGVKTIILARFVPIVRTFAPFVAGVGRMNYRIFVTYSVVGNLIWVTFLTFAGYLFGGLEFVKNNFEFMVLGIILISVLPMIIEYIKYKKGPKVTQEELKRANQKEIEETFEKENLK